VAWRGGRRHVERLVRSPSAGSSGARRVRADGTYLVTGGLGGLGLAVARWLVDEGARDLVLLGRSPLPPGAEEPGPAALAELRGRGARVTYAAVDVADADRLAEFLRRFRAQAGAPIRGVVHAAGTWRDQSLERMDSAALAEVLRPKVLGAWLLDRLLADCDLDWFVLFGSFSSILPAHGQANYAAANAFLDGLAQLRRREGKPFLSIAWGPWSEVGFGATATGASAHRRLLSLGIERLSPRQGITALSRLLGHGEPMVSVIPIDWARLAGEIGEVAAAPLFAEVMAAAEAREGARPAWEGARDGAAAAEFERLLLAHPPDEQLDLVTARLRAIVGRVTLRSPEAVAAEEALTSAGVDSLMAVEIKNGIARETGVDLPLVRLLDDASVSALSKLVLADVKAAALRRGAGTPLGEEGVPMEELAL